MSRQDAAIARWARMKADGAITERGVPDAQEVELQQRLLALSANENNFGVFKPGKFTE